ncbi:MAG: hypothetical protein ABIM99_06265 [Candidatus Dojkabacteria bacterium]
MNNRRKVTLAALFGMTLLLAGVSIFITLRIQQNNAAADANASGFGATATTNKFNSVFAEFASYPCSAFLTQDKLGENTVITKITKSTNNLELLGAQSYIPFSCTYTLSDTQSIDIVLHSYDENSYIDDSAETLYARININLSSVLDKEFMGIGGNYTTVFFGPSASPVSFVAEANTCRTNIFHSQNDLEYLEVVYKGFSDCNAILKDNLRISGNLTGTLVFAMFNVNKKF